MTVMNHLIGVEADGARTPLQILKDRAPFLQPGTFVAIVSPQRGEAMLQTLNWIKQRQMNPCHLWLSHGSSSDKQWLQVLALRGIAGYSIRSLQDLPIVLGGTLRMNEGNSLWSRLFIFEWERRLTALFTGIFLLQFVYWISKEDGLWLPETVRIVEYTLLITFLIHIIPFIHYSLRGILHVASVIWISAALLNFHWISPSGRSILDFVTANVLGLTPYLWFGLVACVLYLLTIWWVGVKWRIYTLSLSACWRLRSGILFFPFLFCGSRWP